MVGGRGIVRVSSVYIVCVGRYSRLEYRSPRQVTLTECLDIQIYSDIFRYMDRRQNCKSFPRTRTISLTAPPLSIVYHRTYKTRIDRCQLSQTFVLAPSGPPPLRSIQCLSVSLFSLQSLFSLFSFFLLCLFDRSLSSSNSSSRPLIRVLFGVSPSPFMPESLSLINLPRWISIIASFGVTIPLRRPAISF